MNILVTGGSGYIGTELIRRLAADKAVERIVVYDNLSRQNYNLFLGDRFSGHTKVVFVKGELLDSRNLKKSLDGIDVVYHLAARVTTPFAHSDAHLYEQINHWGTAELVYAVEASAVKRFIYTSSVGVYGSSEHALDESIAPNPKTFYAISKLRGEEHVARLNDKMDTYIFRCGNVYGYSPSMRFDAVINKFVFEANFEKRITIHGNGEQTRTFIHIDLVSQALANVLAVKLKSGTYNLVDRTLSVMDIVDELKQLIPDLEFILINQHMKLNQLMIKSNTEINKQLGINNDRPIKDELKEFLSRLSF
ncbi:MAG: NAD-dependent epimerase/dehydratase [Cyclobacteriaceae bacterium]|nr:NAD-dependent epimerase/dehydratase [Cyclobacteriaceae bacterium]UYN85492.1 MAG: NAD-dependent epimerase/dehydratase [Cyclobacteriaceae bacterium]